MRFLRELTAYHVRIPLKRAIRHASHSRHETDNLILRCILQSGAIGYGEGVPRDYVTGETVDTAIELLSRADIGSQISNFSSWEDAVRGIEALKLPAVPDDQRKCMGNAARCALELALLDAFGHHFGFPLSAVPKLLTPKLYEPKPRVRYSAAITSARGWKARAAAVMMRVYRFKQLKVKVGIQGYDDVHRLRNIRRCVGSRMDLRVDANEAWSADEAAERIRELQGFGITSVEQPVPHEQVARLAEVRRRVDTPIMLDESLCGLTDAQQAISQGTCDLFNLRLSKCGGFIPSLRLAELARDHGLGYQLGCQVGETAVLSAAGRHFAASVRDIRYLEGSYDRHLVTEPLTASDLTFGLGGWAPALEGPGLGIRIEGLPRVTVREVTLVG